MILFSPKIQMFKTASSVFCPFHAYCKNKTQARLDMKKKGLGYYGKEFILDPQMGLIC